MQNARYIKLGKGGAWAADSIKRARLRFGWSDQALADIQAGRWGVIEAQVRQQMGASRGAATHDFNSLRAIAESTPADIWITFHGGRLWWGRVAEAPIEEDAVSKYRRLHGDWSDRDLNGRQLLTTQLPGKLQQLQGYRATQCGVSDPDLLRRVICGVRSAVSAELQFHREAAARAAGAAIEALHWRDFELLVDMVFRATGWVRESVLGQQEHGYDLALRERITGDINFVQVKSRAGLAEVQGAAIQFPPDACRRVFFVVHTPAPDLRRVHRSDLPAHVELVDPERLAELAIESGLSRWLEGKVT